MGLHPPSHPGQPPPPPATAPTAAPITTACDNFFATLTAACSALEARAPTVPPAQALRWSITLWGRRVVARGPRGQGSGQVERGHTSVDFRAIQAARAAAAPCSSSGNVQRWSHVAETPVIPDPRALDSLTATACSMLLPRSYAASTLLMVFHGASGEPVGVRRTMRGACKGSSLFALRVRETTTTPALPSL